MLRIFWKVINSADINLKFQSVFFHTCNFQALPLILLVPFIGFWETSIFCCHITGHQSPLSLNDPPSLQYFLLFKAAIAWGIITSVTGNPPTGGKQVPEGHQGSPRNAWPPAVLGNQGSRSLAQS